MSFRVGVFCLPPSSPPTLDREGHIHWGGGRWYEGRGMRIAVGLGGSSCIATQTLSVLDISENLMVKVYVSLLTAKTLIRHSFAFLIFLSCI